MVNQAITLEKILNKVKRDFKISIVEMMNNASFSKPMIGSFIFIPEPYLSEYFNELLQEKKIFEVGIFYCKVSNTVQPFYGTQKTVEFIKRFQNEK